MNSMTINDLLAAMWRDYIRLNPQADRIARLFADRGEEVVNDHIALRTFNLPGIGIDVLAEPFVRGGYQPRGTYSFPNKKLVAKHFEAPGLPKVFVSELQVELFPPEVREMVTGLVAQMDPSLPERQDFCMVGRPWNLSYDVYTRLREASEYAAWVAAHGFRPNHFTVMVNALRTFQSLQQVNDFLEAQGFVLNDSGGKIKGSAAVLLEQSSVLANTIDVAFDDGIHPIPGCYYEFARRYPGPDGELYQGFVAASADRIFESTDRGQ
ncbi:MAG TPA: DUF1338 domain-containing protein [Polyangiaceae bacterium]|nr:MAG: hypothetical protein BWY17_03957 [Deltaproteobacteria bacterium ADurb.Bin207]HOE51805.1 DUF1338 domain-containing protein [Polyangiaceae bacterium]HOH03383.1 DUF1338 domain-containing protein [Polyangiaceae bacterium]HQF24424.1 DUF1338 domain-containing protein [Polyangiaceae bacterium]HQM11731.1 DUF1338 domain-containing protein [Polyangiaceae bacterium]